MKKISKVLILLLLVMFLGINCAKAEANKNDAKDELENANNGKAIAVGQYCYYTFDGMEPEDDDYQAIIAISADGKLAGADVYGAAGQENVRDWKPGGGCPPVLGLKKYTAGYIFWTEYELYAVYNIDGATKNSSGNNRILGFGTKYLETYILVDDEANADKTVKMTCKYDVGTFTFNNNNRVIDYSLVDDKTLTSEFWESIKAIGDICPTLELCEGKAGNDDYIYFADYSADKRASNGNCKKIFCTNTDNEKCQPDSIDARQCPQFTLIDESSRDYYCQNVMRSRNFTDNCLQVCMRYLKVENKFTNSVTTECGFSVKLLVWIENILRWIKYIVPVVLIVLSILDFMKALASEKEDEMKKAQKHFVIRLVAAVLIFLIPIILSFVMEKMGFSAESCGIKGIGF